MCGGTQVRQELGDTDDVLRADGADLSQLCPLCQKSSGLVVFLSLGQAWSWCSWDFGALYRAPVSRSPLVVGRVLVKLLRGKSEMVPAFLLGSESSVFTFWRPVSWIFTTLIRFDRGALGVPFLILGGLNS